MMNPTTATAAARTSFASRVTIGVSRRTGGCRRDMSSTAKVWIDKNTRVICQGFTGKQVRILNDAVLFVLFLFVLDLMLCFLFFLAIRDQRRR